MDWDTHTGTGATIASSEPDGLLQCVCDRHVRLLPSLSHVCCRCSRLSKQLDTV